MPDATDLELMKLTFYDYLEEYMEFVTSLRGHEGTDVREGKELL